MIARLRRKFVAISMSLIALVLLVALSALFVFTRDGMINNSQQVLARAVSQTSLTARPGSQDIQLPFFTLFVLSGDSANVAVLTGGNHFTLDTDTISRVANECLAREKTTGVLESWSLRYMKQESFDGIRMAFVDMSYEISALRELARNLMLIGAVAFLVLLAVSTLLARWAVKPTELAFERQKAFVSDASHELNTPLAVILSNIELLGEDVSPQSGDGQRVERIAYEARRMKKLVGDLLTVARGDREGKSLNHQPVDLSAAAERCALLFEPLFFESGRSIALDIEPGVRVMGDGDRLRQLLEILLDNANKYSNAGSEAVLTLGRHRKKTVLSVTSRGRQIPAEALPRLFERFYRLDGARDGSGNGLGLAIAAQIAAEHRGSLTASSSDEGENVFTLTIPALI